MSIEEGILRGLSAAYSRSNDFIREVELPNGISLSSQRRISGKNLEFSVLINAGSFEDPLDKQGVAHFLEHLLIGPKIEKKIQRLGGYVSLATSTTYIHLSGAVPNSEENRIVLGDTISTFLNASSMTEEGFNREKVRILNEIGIDHDNAGRYQGTLLEKAFLNNRADGSITGTREEVRSISYQGLIDFKQKYFIGSNVFVGITGAYSFEEMQSILEEKLGGISKGTPSLLYSPEVIPSYHSVSNPELFQTYFSFCFPIEKISQSKIQIAKLAGSYLNAKMTEDVIFGSGIVYAANFRHLFTPLRSGYLDVKGNIMPEDAGKVIPEIGGVIVRAIEGIDEDVFEGVKIGELSNIASDTWLPPMHDAQNLSFNKMFEGGEKTMAVQKRLVETVTVEDIHKYLIDDVFSFDPAIVTYGDDSNFGSYNDFVEPIRGALARINSPSSNPSP